MIRLKDRSKKCTLIVMCLINLVMIKSLIKQWLSRNQTSNSIFWISLANQISLHFSQVRNRVISSQAMEIKTSSNPIRHKYHKFRILKYNRKRKARLISSTMKMMRQMIQFPVVEFLSVNSSILCSSNKLKKQRNRHSKTHSLILSVVPSRSHSNNTTHIRSKHHPYLTHLEASLPWQRNPRNNHRTIISPFSSSRNLVNNNNNSHL